MVEYRNKIIENLLKTGKNNEIKYTEIKLKTDHEHNNFNTDNFKIDNLDVNLDEKSSHIHYEQTKINNPIHIVSNPNKNQSKNYLNINKPSNNKTDFSSQTVKSI